MAYSVEELVLIIIAQFGGKATGIFEIAGLLHLILPRKRDVLG
jgi:hypothetical protein